MRVFNYSKIKDKKCGSEVFCLVDSIYRYQGKQKIYFKEKPKGLNKLMEITMIQSSEALNEIDGIVTTSVRLKKFVQEEQ